MPFTLVAALKDLRRRFTDPAALVMWVGLPVILGGLMSLLGGDGGPAPKAHVLLVDEDQTLVSGLVARAGNAGQLGEFLQIEPVSADVGRRKIDDGDASAMLVIPKGFQDGVLREQPTQLTLVTNPAQRILPRIIEEGLRIVIEATFYAQRLFGEPLRQVVDNVSGVAGPPSDDAVAAVSRAVNQRLRVLEKTLLPPVIVLEVKAATEAATTQPSFGALFLPGLLLMALLFTAQGVSIDIWAEKLAGTLRRTLTTPQHAAAFLAGKLLAGVGIMTLASFVALVAGIALFKVPVGRAALALAWSAYAGAALLCYLMLIQLAATSARGAQLLGTLTVFPLIMIGGSFFPFEAMPPWMANIGRWTPNGLAVVHIKAVLFGTIDRQGLLMAAIGIGVPALLAFGLCLRRLAGRFATS